MAPLRETIAGMRERHINSLHVILNPHTLQCKDAGIGDGEIRGETAAAGSEPGIHR